MKIIKKLRFLFACMLLMIIFFSFFTNAWAEIIYHLGALLILFVILGFGISDDLMLKSSFVSLILCILIYLTNLDFQAEKIAAWQFTFFLIMLFKAAASAIIRKVKSINVG